MDSIEQLELRRLKLQNDIEMLEKKMNWTNSEGRISFVCNKSEMRKNALEVKQLRTQVEELQVRLKKQELGDIKLIQETLQEKYRGTDEIKGNSPKTIIQSVESRFIDLNNKSQDLLHRLQLLMRSYADSEQMLKEMNEYCRDDNLPTEADCIQNIRDLEREHLKVLKNISDSENAKIRMKSVLQILEKRGNSYRQLLMDLKKEGTKTKEKRDTEEKTEKEDRHLEDNEREIESLKSQISFIKDVTACKNVQDIDSRFIEQKAVHEDLLELIKKSKSRIQELKEEKRDLTSKRALMKEADVIYPQSDAELSSIKQRMAEQETRLDSANAELERINSVSNRAKEVFQRLISKIKPKASKDLSNANVVDLSKQLEKIVVHSFPKTDHKSTSKNDKKECL